MKAEHLIGSLDDQQDPIFGSLIHNTRVQWWGHSVNLRSKHFCVVSEQRKSEERRGMGFSGLAAQKMGL